MSDTLKNKCVTIGKEIAACAIIYLAIEFILSFMSTFSDIIGFWKYLIYIALFFLGILFITCILYTIIEITIWSIHEIINYFQWYFGNSSKSTYSSWITKDGIENRKRNEEMIKKKAELYRRQEIRNEFIGKMTDDMKNQYNEGYNKNYQIGITEGRIQGQKLGYSDGYNGNIPQYK